jgi:hypothetical protein
MAKVIPTPPDRCEHYFAPTSKAGPHPCLRCGEVLVLVLDKEGPRWTQSTL